MLGKRCKTCGEQKPLTEFHKQSRAKDGKNRSCKICIKEIQLRHKYNVSSAEKESMLVAQGGVCAVCKTDAPTQYGFHLDHNHRTGKNRGILCPHCNALIGLARESQDILIEASNYLWRTRD